MEWHVNDLSLNGQFPTSEALASALEPLLAARQRHDVLRDRLYCSREFYLRPASGTATFRELVNASPKRLFKSQVLSWLAKAGPFWNDEREANPDDYFECKDQDVTDQGLGEAARRRISSKDARTFSFSGGPVSFEESPLDVHQGLREQRLALVQVPNCWTVAALSAAALEALPVPASWKDAIARFDATYPHLVFSDALLEQVGSHPFSRGILDRANDLLGVLEELSVQSDAAGRLTARGQELLNQFFVGEKAWFSDESETNKRRFRNELMFADPQRPDTKLFCPWHGKIKISQFRIHFEWPRALGQQAIKVTYFGPKITKG